MVNRIFNIINFIYSLYFNFRYLPFKQAVNLPIWITTNFRVHGLKRGQLILGKPIHRSVMFGCWGSLGLQQMKGKLIFSKNSHLILRGHTVISQGSVLRMDNGAFIELGNDFYCNKIVILELHEICFLAMIVRSDGMSRLILRMGMPYFTTVNPKFRICLLILATMYG